MFVEVALPLPIRTTFTYAVPAELQDRAHPGARVLVPFRQRERIGWIDRVVQTPHESRKIRELHGILDDEPVVAPPLLDLCRWIADYYLAPLGQVLRSALPASLSDSSSEWIELVNGNGAPDLSTASAGSGLDARLLSWLYGKSGPQPVARLRRECGDRAWWPVIRRLEAAEILRIGMDPPRTEPPVRTRRVVRVVTELPSLVERERVFGRARRQRECYDTLEGMGGAAELTHLTGALGFGSSVVRGLVERGLVESADEEISRDPYASVQIAEAPHFTPTPRQAAAIATLINAARTAQPGTWLLRGVTGSGKTLVYIELLREIVERQGRTAIVLVPEIALTPQTVGRFKAVFGDKVAVLHSALGDGERYDEWRALRAGEKRIVVGARSAIFAPLQDLGAIVVDEEHEGSYKQGEPPRYHAREVATMRAHLEGALCVLGSATPALESWHNVHAGKFGLLELPARIADRPLPPIRIVDLREERKQERKTTGPLQTRTPTILSAPLEDALRTRVARGEQSILLLNRRGYATFVQCRECGQVWHCPSCNVSLTYHRRRARLVCHHCFHEEDKPERCSACGSTELSFRGVGTEQVERAVGDALPAARVARMDVDTTSGKWAHHRILQQVERGEVDILLGTQMIAKGLDFPNVTLVGVINADVGINLPDFRATERTFQLLTQVAGRAGRGPKGGEVFIQTAIPDHYVVTCATEHDFEGFVARELLARREPSYPPFSRLVNVVVSGLEEGATQETASDAADWVRGLIQSRGIDSAEVVGPAPCPIDRIRGRWRWHFLLRAESSRLIGELARFFYERFDPPAGKYELRIALDRDPVALL
ncbi:MAG: primosomal protein N' [Gemmatimonadetes bacterium]|nr:primosomal protein N' [Gemmatimonadota bacterium]